MGKGSGGGGPRRLLQAAHTCGDARVSGLASSVPMTAANNVVGFEGSIPSAATTSMIPCKAARICKLSGCALWP